MMINEKEVVRIGDREFSVIRQVEINGLGHGVPLVDIPLQSDEDWQETAKRNAIDNYTRENGKLPKNAEEATNGGRAW